MTATPGTTKARKPSTKGEGSSVVPRKRRRRAVGSGAADDCFTCASRQVRCDRRRPYCTPCLDMGRQCSGYKTTLTWGIGVASRGKLRGLSLPISGAKKVTQSTEPRSVPSQPAEVKAAEKSRRVQEEAEPAPTQTPTPTSPWSAINSTPPRSTSSGSNGSNSSSSNSITGSVAGSISMTSSATTSEPTYPPLAAYNSTYSPIDACVYRSTGPYLGHSTISISTNTAPAQHQHQHSTASAQWYQRYQHLRRARVSLWLSVQCHNHSLRPLEVYSTPVPQKRYIEEELDESETAVSSNVSIYNANTNNTYHYQPYPTAGFSLNQPFSTTWIGRNPRMRYLIGYYTEVIAPVIVTFDSPNNPFRLYLLELAKDSEALQHAIAALSLSNLRQRRRNWGLLSTGKTDPSRRSLQAHCRMTERAFEEAFGVTTPEEQLREESYHKGMAIRSINAQLADPVQRRTDSVFATLLMLCLFHMCDTGLASFRSQFAGVKKLFMIRGAGRDRGSQDSDVMKWFMRMFTCTARDGAPYNSQYQYSLVDISAIPVSQLDPRTEFWREWHVVRQKLESWRLPDLPGAHTHHPLTHSPAPSLASTISTAATTTSSSSSSTTTSTISTPTSTSLFTAPLPASPLSHINPANLPEISNISESFRYSALLYLERLAHPTTPSRHPRFQTLVSAALHYIQAVKSDVFLLWPLFVVGSECTGEAERAIIRERCCDIQRDSGFVNNLSCLQLLERIWQEEDPNESGSGTPPSGELLGGAAFRWRRIIDSQRLTDEYIVV
ncbi:hypothetical protein TEQG_08764 [Trichophyton equinum CBS 127.97]|uniref:Zn(2)-C6 fungal-type domain-containing protein n=1 Tax=Trichophyton equinum (strain ATCC MYA-4606 / CBS 127.97) TaxID=559882 RepID=F2Q0H4_TRIEC|nr:hypothetical protein TEQG_08764 [Trichophyton equinum CBS 127.97]